MPSVSLTPAHLAPFATIAVEKAEAMIDDVMALAARVAPCISESDFAHDAAARAILRRVVLRWNDQGSGVLTTESVDDYSGTTDTRQPSKNLFWPSEITQLQDLCRTDEPQAPTAFAIDTVSTSAVQHADACSLNFGATYCSCGAELTQGLPLWETGW
jgi:hypothetical protein